MYNLHSLYVLLGFHCFILILKEFNDLMFFKSSGSTEQILGPK